jgi:hypothetical protein
MIKVALLPDEVQAGTGIMALVTVAKSSQNKKQFGA